ncbi:sodium:solute symporter [Marinactinospora thermotolerans]|uniref:Solute:Na+ symporter, SSS family n=1 Tax=Marinactinospora thermotolerans DSM 45154 TaxID=1122192 RepID=A0A1T4NDP5_9ACTN|nr:sodium:solute symporter [Marinactinospora thermotolerans]SJZ77461.1 solute:Na+ symporter, SSS family [Marinactinospora thermotolerans DSM 45154]
MGIDIAVIAAYLLGMLALGWWGMRRTQNRSDYLVAGRRLGVFMYSGTMAAVVLGGASTIGGIGLGYTYGISGAWLVGAIGLGIILLHLFFARRISRLRVYTVSEMLDLRYGGGSRVISGLVMWGYTFMLTVPSTLAFSTVFSGLFDMPRAVAIILGGAIVVTYSTLGGMWSVTMTDIAQFIIKTIGLLLILTPIAVWHAGGISGMREALGPAHFDPLNIGGGTIFTYFLIYTLGLLIGQDIWQRVFTGRNDRVAMRGGLGAGVYCLIYAVAGALIGTAAAVLFPGLDNPDDAFTLIVEDTLPVGVAGLVLAAALSAVMSTASGALIACSTVTATDLWPQARRLFGRSPEPAEGGQRDEVAANRMFTLVLGIASICVSLMVSDVVSALTVAYNILVGGLLVAILGGLIWKRGTRAGALASMLAGAVVVIVTMAVKGMLANEPIYYGLGASLVVYVVVSLCTKPTDADVIATWQARLRGEGADEEAQAPAPAN